MSNQLSDWNNLLQLSTGISVKAQMTSQFLCWTHLYEDDPQLWLLAPKTSRIFPLDIAPAYIKHQYNSGMKEPPEAGNVTGVIRARDKDTFYLISQDSWMETVKINRNKGGRISDFQLSGNLIYILREGGVLFIAELSTTEGLKGLGLIENLSQPSQCLTLDGNFLYMLGSHTFSAGQSKLPYPLFEENIGDRNRFFQRNSGRRYIYSDNHNSLATGFPKNLVFCSQPS